MDDIRYLISEVSEMFEVSYRTLHYYEQKFSLLIERDGSGNRLYSEDNIKLFEMIFELKKRGLSLDGIKTVLQEKGFLKFGESNHIVVVDEKSLEVKDILIEELRSVISRQIREEFKETKEKLEVLTLENRDLREEIKSMKHQNEEHYNKIDIQLSAWRENSKRPWYKKMFKPK